MIRPDLLKAVFESLGSHPYLAPEDFSVNEYTTEKVSLALLSSIATTRRSSSSFTFLARKQRNPRKYTVTHTGFKLPCVRGESP